MAHYGAGFPEFIEGFPAAAGLPYLADVARLEMLRVGAYHAADADTVPPQQIALLLSAPECLPTACFTLHPSLRILRSQHAVVSLWAAHQSDDIDAALAAVDITRPQSALLVRVGLDVEVYRITAGAATFIQHLQQGCGLGTAADLALATDASFDMADTLGLLIRTGALTEIVTSRSKQS